MEINFEKGNGLVPVIIQNALSMQVLMLGYMNREAYDKTLQEGKVTFYSRSKQRLWTKGETSGNFLEVKNIYPDCDNDSILIEVIPAGPTCHTGSASCFGNNSGKGFIYELEEIINNRIESDDESSYTNKLYRQGINKVAQKVGEEAVELIIEAKDENEELFKNESADLLYHFLILLKMKHKSFSDIENVLSNRKK